MISERQRKLHRLIVAANAQPTEWLIDNLRNPSAHQLANSASFALSRIACLRIIAARTDTSGMVYRARIKATRARIGV